jgi:hypothetical protein
MAAIITVHGTGASGPEEGNKWWQRGSEFEKHIRELVEGADGTALKTQRLIWDGANSETSRRRAAAELYGKAQQLESTGERYCLVGHSHGGSVIANTLLLIGLQRGNLPHLARLIAVGTPFIHLAKSFWLFARLGIIGKSALVSIVGVIFVIVIGLVASEFEMFLWFRLVPCVALYVLLYFINSKQFAMSSPRAIRQSSVTYSQRFVSLRHKDDEAINGLKALTATNPAIFSKDFSVPTFMVASLFSLPAMLIAIAGTAWLFGMIDEVIHPLALINPFIS